MFQSPINGSLLLHHRVRRVGLEKEYPAFQSPINGSLLLHGKVIPTTAKFCAYWFQSPINGSLLLQLAETSGLGFVEIQEVSIPYKRVSPFTRHYPA